jgi:hypothetical protein
MFIIEYKFNYGIFQKVLKSGLINFLLIYVYLEIENNEEVNFSEKPRGTGRKINFEKFMNEKFV